jgi:N-acetylneuraminic acid mutarotase
VDEWTDLPPVPVHSFGLGQVNGTLVAVGGKSEDSQRTNDVYMYDPISEKWVKKMSMQIPRASMTVVGLKSALVVVGGYSDEYVNLVEIIDPQTQEKLKSEPLPIAASNMSAFPVNENECYILGGYKPSRTSSPCENKVFHAKLDNLHRKVISSEHATPVDTQPAWKPLPNTPTYQPAAAMLVGSLFAIGGWETSAGKIPSTKIHAYSPSTNSWVHVSDLPAPRAVTTAAVLSPTTLLVIGGWDSGKRVNIMHKGMLTIRL